MEAARPWCVTHVCLLCHTNPSLNRVSTTCMARLGVDTTQSTRGSKNATQHYAGRSKRPPDGACVCHATSPAQNKTNNNSCHGTPLVACELPPVPAQ